MKLFKWVVTTFLLLALQPVLAAESGTALKADAIKKEPYSDEQ